MSTYIRLTDYKSSDEKERGYFDPKNRYKAKQEDFEKIPGSPIAYWINQKILNIFSKNKTLKNLGIGRAGLITGNSDKFIKKWHEASLKHIEFNCDSYEDSKVSHAKWFPINNGGDSIKWYGNHNDIVFFKNGGIDILSQPGSSIRNKNYYFKECINWNNATYSHFSARYSASGSIFSGSSSAFFLKEAKFLFLVLPYLNSKVSTFFKKILSDSHRTETGHVEKLPFTFPKEITEISSLSHENIDISKEEWDSRETSWDFRTNELVRILNDEFLMLNEAVPPLEMIYIRYCDYWREKFFQLHANEEELNRLFIEIYGLHDELTPNVPLEDITILKNEAKIMDGELVFQKEEIVKQLISYAVGVMFGRYSLDHEGLYIANLGQSVEEANSTFNIQNPTFEIDDDNIIPVLEDAYFDDDIVGRFYAFLKAAFGEEYLEENIRFVEEALGKSVRKYFVKDFYEDHIKRYKKRPIYWMVSSPKHAFNALFYMHRYRPDIFARIQTGYLHEYMAKLEAKLADARRVALDEGSSAKERKAAQKEIERIEKALKELRAFDTDALSHYATQSIEIDLDDGVKVNYCRFKEILWPIKGLCKS